MRSFFLIMIGLMCRVLPGTAQISPGVYFTYDEFKNNKPSVSVDSKTNSLVTDRFHNEAYVFVKQKDKELKIAKDSIFAIVYGDGTTFRFVNKQLYKLLDRSSLWLYERDFKSTGFTRRTSRGNLLETKNIKTYFFSINGCSAIEPLKTQNLEEALRLNKQKSEMLSEKFKRDDQLLSRTNDGKYELNEYLKELNNN